MPLTWNEIRKRSIEFSNSWKDVEKERAEAQTFWNEFFDVFGQSRRKVAIFEQEVKKLDQKNGYIDLFWPKVLVAEAKSKGKDLVKAKDQAFSYLYGIPDEMLPKYILTSDFENMSLLDLETDKSYQFRVSKLHEHIKLFSFIAGYAKTDFKVDDPVNIKAAELMGKLHDSLFDAGYSGHPLEVFLVRILFCLFADDTGIFERGIFLNFLKNKTRIDGSDVGPQLEQVFQILNTSEDKRLKNLDEDLLEFPYVNGGLFEELIPMASFDSGMRNALLSCCSFDWSNISPAVFGSLFQSVMNKEIRRNLGAHYTSEENILKLIRPLFLDDLRNEFEKAKTNKNKLNEFHQKLARLKFFDPACGCGNFLVVTYREIRLLELEVLKLKFKNRSLLDVKDISLLNVDQMYGIEIEEFPARIAEVAMWLMDHQMNNKFSEELGMYFIRLPLKHSAKIVNGNALQIDWESVIKKEEVSYILGNPPFVGKQFRNKEQSDDHGIVMKGLHGAGVLDYVACWYIKAAKFINGTKIKVAFVSTNSITQGEQVGILWNELFNKYGIKIHFAHRTFQWNNEARGKAAVHVVIVGFAQYDVDEKYIFEYENIKGLPHELKVKNICPYLVEGNDVVVLQKSKPLCDVPEIVFGSMPNDGGNLLLSEEEKNDILIIEPNLIKLIKPLVSAKEYLNGINRFCFWLVEATPNEIMSSRVLKERIDKIREYRSKSSRLETKKLADYPTLFGEIRQPKSSYVLIPKTSSENRLYVPISFFEPSSIANDSCLVIPNANFFHFGIIQSTMHMTWLRNIGGRLESRYRYSNKLVYNTFPWPEKITDSQKKNVENCVRNILSIRNEFSDSTLANLYNPLSMPPKLLKAHKELDSAVDKCYRSKVFKNETERMEFLFGEYSKLVQVKN